MHHGRDHSPHDVDRAILQFTHHGSDHSPHDVIREYCASWQRSLTTWCRPKTPSYRLFFLHHDSDHSPHDAIQEYCLASYYNTSWQRSLTTWWKSRTLLFTILPPWQRSPTTWFKPRQPYIHHHHHPKSRDHSLCYEVARDPFLWVIKAITPAIWSIPHICQSSSYCTYIPSFHFSRHLLFIQSISLCLCARDF